MTEEELIAQYISIDSLPSKTTFHVARMLWDGAAPRIDWIKYAEISDEPTDAVIERQIREILANAEYFSVCQECGECKPAGWMLSANRCHSCAGSRVLRSHGP